MKQKTEITLTFEMKVLDQILERLKAIEEKDENSKSFMSSVELAEYLNIAKSQTYKLVQAREIPYYRPNSKRIYFKRTEVDGWVEKHRYKSQSEIDHEATEYINSKR